jgi:hypothetical protein
MALKTLSFSEILRPYDAIYQVESCSLLSHYKMYAVQLITFEIHWAIIHLPAWQLTYFVAGLSLMNTEKVVASWV